MTDQKTLDNSAPLSSVDSGPGSPQPPRPASAPPEAIVPTRHDDETQQRDDAAQAGNDETRPCGRGRRLAVVVASTVAIFTVAGVVAFGLYQAVSHFGGDPVVATAGDCITAAATEDMEVVDCAAGDAAFQVVGVLENKTQAEAATGCLEFPEASQYVIEYKGTLTDSTTGRILCLGTVPTEPTEPTG